MIQPPELKLHLPMVVGDNMNATTTQVWQMLQAAHTGNLDIVRCLSTECAGLLYAQYNYAPPIHFAVREGHTSLVKYLLEKGAHDPGYKIYPFRESLQTIAEDRGLNEIVAILDEYAAGNNIRYRGDNGEIDYGRTPEEKEFEKAVDKNELAKVRRMLKDRPSLALDNTFFWSEGVLTRPVKDGYFELIDCLLDHGATVPTILKWGPNYYFETYTHAEYIMARGMGANTMSWQHVTLLHDMAQRGLLNKAELLVRYGAELNPIDEAYQSTPLGMAARWGRTELVEFLLKKGADPNLAGAAWATPLSWSERRGHEAIATMLKKAGARN
jgi:ankyrin repeat protein